MYVCVCVCVCVCRCVCVCMYIYIIDLFMLLLPHKKTKTVNRTADFSVLVLEPREFGRHLGHCRPCENCSALSLIEYVSPISLGG